ncbi:hypothetical protein BASA62_007514 [Batrachochytrium salamandrivorans]|nr:hypothetical protein BASA62_007514 [Batrachochytrium salamandrivorans]
MTPKSKHVKVVIRTRPTSSFAQDIITFGEDKKSLHIHIPKNEEWGFINNQQENWDFKFDNIMHNSSQEGVYENCGGPIIKSLLDGYNATIMAYGQTGAGKTFTMTGASENYKHRGLIPRAISHLYNEIAQRSTLSFTVRISYLEVYNEQMIDLLAPTTGVSISDNLTVVEEKNGSTHVKGLKIENANNEEEALNLLFEGETNRSISEHQLNKGSTRSHCIFTVYIESRSHIESSEKIVTSKLNLVDLAGSERLSKTETKGKSLKEATYINRSLTYLEQVIIALSDKKRDHIPFRQSKMTHVLRDSLGGNCNTLMIANIWGEQEHIEETISTLRFATRMMCVATSPEINIHYDPQALIKKYEREIKELKQELSMHDTLCNRSHIQYEQFSETQRHDLGRLVRAYIDNEEDELEIINLRQIKEVLSIFRLKYKSLEGELEGVQQRALKQVSENPTGSKESSFDPHLDPGLSSGGSRKVAAYDADGDEGVGDVESSGFGIGLAPSGMRYQQGVTNGGTFSVTSGNILPVQSNIQLLNKRDRKLSKKNAVDREIVELLHEPSLGINGYGNTESDLRRRESGIVIDTTQGIFSGVAGGSIRERKTGATPLSRADEFEAFKCSKGAELNRILAENKLALREKRRVAKELAESVNQITQELNELKGSLDQKTDAHIKNSGSEDIIIDEDKYIMLNTQKQLKTKYKEKYDSLHATRIEVEYCTKITDQSRQKLMSEFEQWYESIYGSQNTDGGGTGVEDVLDIGEKFDILQMERMSKEDPDSLPYYNARKSTERRSQRVASKRGGISLAPRGGMRVVSAMANSNPAYTVSQLLDKMTSSDSDFRFMAVNDLTVEVTKDYFILDEGTERKLVTAVLKLIDDKNGEVQNMAVKCLVPLVRKARESQTQVILEELCKMLATVEADNEGLRDIAGIALKTVILELPLDAPFLGGLVRRLIPNMLDQLQRASTSPTPSSDQTLLDIIDILSEIVSRLGFFLSLSADANARLLQQKSIQTFYPLLDNPRPAIRKRVIIAIGSLVLHLADDLFDSLLKQIISDIVLKSENSSASPNLQKLQSLISCSATISRASPSRFSPFLPEILQLVLKNATLDDTDLREQCIQAVESFIICNPSSVKQQMPEIIKLVLEYIKYDPNYLVEDDDNEEIGDEEEDEEVDDEENYSDDDDVSWKVRRSSAKLLSSLISTCPDLLLKSYSDVAVGLIRRFSEREESVRIDILNTFITLLQQTLPGKLPHSTPAHSVSDMADTDDSPLLSQLGVLVPRIVKALTKQLVGKSIPTRSTGFMVLKQLVLVLCGGMNECLGAIIPAIEHSLSNVCAGVGGGHGSTTNTNLKIEILEFLKIRAEAFSVMAVLIKTLRPFGAGCISKELTFDKKQAGEGSNLIPTPPSSNLPFISSILKFTLRCMEATDTSAEVKENVISTLGVLIFQAGDLIPPTDFSLKVVPLIVDRLKSEVTRLVTIRCITYFVGSPLAVPPLPTLSEFIPYLPVIVSEISDQLRKSHRQLRIAAVVALDAIVCRFNCQDMYGDILNVLHDMLTTDSDLQVLPLALSLLISMMRHGNARATSQLIQPQVVPAIIRIVCDTPHLVSGGASLDLLLEFWAMLVGNGADDQFSTCVEGLFDRVYSCSSKEAYPIVSKSIAALATSNTPDAMALLQKLMLDVVAVPGDQNTRYLALLSIGEIGNRRDLSQVAPTLHDTLFGLFDSPSEDIKTAAAFAVGNIASGNLLLYLPMIVEAVRAATIHQYLPLLALKEVIEVSLTTESARSTMSPFVPTIWQVLFDKSDTELEDITRNTVAECLGLISTADATTFLPQLRSLLTSTKATTRATVVSAVRYTFSTHRGGRADAYRLLLAPFLVDFLRLVQDPDLNVRRVTIGVLNAAAHSTPQLIGHFLPELLPLLYQETFVKDSLIHIVEMGPFKHKIDTGLDTRKSAFECMYTLLDACFVNIEVDAFIQRAIAGIADPAHEIKLISHLMVQRLTVVAPAAISTFLDSIADMLKVTLTLKIKPSAVKQEIEKHRELMHTACKSLVLLAGVRTRCSGAYSGMTQDDMPKFAELLKETKTPGAVCYDIFGSVQIEVAAATNVSSVSTSRA